MNNNIEKQIAKLNTELRYHESILKNSKESIKNLNIRIRKLKLQLTNHEITISDHAVVQYLRRFGTKSINRDLFSKDIDNFTNSIIKKHSKTIKSLGGSGTITDGNIKIVVKNYNIVTIINTSI